MVDGRAGRYECTMNSHGENRPPPGIVAGVITFFVLGLPALFITVVGIGQFDEDYCTTVDGMIPGGEVEGASVSGPRFAGPFSVECWNDHGTVRRHEPRPFYFATGMLSGLLLCATLVGMSVSLAGDVRRSSRGSP